MQIVGIICEYNPLHLGHEAQFHRIRQQLPDCALVCLMSGNYVQRGAPAIVDKSLRAQAAVLCGADLVLELPVQYALSSAEGFAAGGVRILAPFCDYLSFGTESGNADSLKAAARALLSPEFSLALRVHLDRGLSFPAARQAALSDMGCPEAPLTRPNDILAVEYCKAILSRGAAMEPLPILRQGDYHAQVPDPKNPSATAVRRCMTGGDPFLEFLPEQVGSLFAAAPIHTLEAGERAILGRLRAMTDHEFEALPYGSEGLWRKLMHAARKSRSLPAIGEAVKSKRYTRTRIDRMILCAFLGLTGADLEAPAPYTRVLAFSDRGRAVLKQARAIGRFLNAGEVPDDPFWETERRLGDLYGLFCADVPEMPGLEANRRIFYHREG